LKATIARRTVSIEEFAAAVGISRTSAYTLAKRGELPGLIRLGGRYVVATSALEKLLGAPIDGQGAA
jgi:predicted DNA-binding transcriptional regulator AlpA